MEWMVWSRGTFFRMGSFCKDGILAVTDLLGFMNFTDSLISSQRSLKLSRRPRIPHCPPKNSPTERSGNAFQLLYRRSPLALAQ
jgi:hypothetical protein